MNTYKTKKIAMACAVMLVGFSVLTACASSQSSSQSTPQPALEIPTDGAFAYRLKVLGID